MDVIEQLCEAVEFSLPMEIDTRRGKRLVRKAPATSEFWTLWRSNKVELQDFGISATSVRGKWEVSLWSDESLTLPELPNEVGALANYDWEALPPLKHPDRVLKFQVSPVKFMVDGLTRRKSYLLGLPTGMGKTYVSLAAARELGLRIVTVCPKTIALDWMRAADYMGVECDAFGWEHMKLEKTEFGHWDKPWWVWTLPPNTLLVLDEIHRARNLNTQTSLLVHAAGRQEVLSAGLSATIGEDPRHLNAIGRWLGLHNGGPDFFNWAAKLGVVKTGDSMRFPDNPNAIRKLHRQIFPEKGCRLRWSDVGEDAPKDHTIAQPLIFDKDIGSVYDGLIVTIKEIKEREDKANRKGFIFAARTAARQKIELMKAPTVVQMAKDLIEEGNSVFIGVNFHETLDYIMAKLKITACIKGGQPDYRRRGAIDAFQANTSRVIVGIISACREGINLHDLDGKHPRYSLIMPCENSFDLKQVLGRTPRTGSKSPSFQRLLYAAGTIEEEVCYSLARKLDNMSLLNDGEIDPMVRVAPLS